MSNGADQQRTGRETLKNRSIGAFPTYLYRELRGPLLGGATVLNTLRQSAAQYCVVRFAVGCARCEPSRITEPTTHNPTLLFKKEAMVRACGVALQALQVVLLLCRAAANRECGKGQYLDAASQTCPDCKVGTSQDSSAHSETSCNPASTCTAGEFLAGTHLRLAGTQCITALTPA